MDDSLLAGLQTATIGGNVLSRYAPNPHHTLYKQHREGYSNQEVRRVRVLERQKNRRQNFMDYSRNIVEGVEFEIAEEMDEGDGFDEVDGQSEKKKVKVLNENNKTLFFTRIDIFSFPGSKKAQKCFVLLTKAQFYF